MSADQSKPVVRYFKGIGARVAPTLLAFEVGGIPYEEVRYTGDEWKEVKMDKEKNPTSTLPSMTVNGVTFNQSHSLAAYAAAVAGLTPTDPLADALEQEGISCLEEVFNGANGILSKCDRDTFQANNFKKWFARIESIVTGDKYFLPGDKPGQMDFWLVAFCDLFSRKMEFLRGIVTKEDVEEYKVISRIVRATKAYPAVASYFERHPEESHF